MVIVLVSPVFILHQQVTTRRERSQLMEKEVYYCGEVLNEEKEREREEVGKEVTFESEADSSLARSD